MQKSKYQLAIENGFITSPWLNMVVSAVAGSGKTTTLLMLLELVRGTTIFIAFNKSIVDELKDRVPKNDFIEIGTSHSIGLRSLNRYFKKKLNLSTNKTWKILETFNEQNWMLPKKKFFQNAIAISELYDAYRVNLCTSIEELIDHADRMGILYSKDQIKKLLQVISYFDTYNKNPLEIDFIDMIYLPAVLPVYLPQPDNLFIDEAQDFNACQHAMVDKMRKRGRFVAVGDPRQSIYGFAGAHPESFNIFLQKENTQLFPLSVCYRCGIDIVKYAQRYNADIEFFPEKDLGEVRWGSIREIKETEMVICRNLRPLMEIFLQLIDLEKRAFIKGKDLGKGLLRLIDGLKPNDSSSDLLKHFRAILLKIENDLVEKGVEVPKNHPTYRNHAEKFSIILRLSLKFSKVKEIREFIEQIFSDNNKDDSVVLSTIHKAKGLESDKVYFLDRHLIPSKFASTKDQLQQEQNLYYVGVTRAKKSLIFLSTNAIKDDDEYITSFEA